MKIVFMGTPAFSAPILEALAERYEVLLVVSQADPKPNKFPEVKVKALELGIPVFQPFKIKENYQPILDVKADVLITAAYGQFIPQIILKSFKKCINVHASLLPKRRGGAPIQRAIMEGDEITGVTLIEMVKKMDAGVMYAKEELPILETDTNHTLFAKLSLLGRDLLMKNIEDIVCGVNKGVLQDESAVTFSPNLTKEEEKISFMHSARAVSCQIRGLAINPGGYVEHKGSILKFYNARVVTGYSGQPGEVLSVHKKLIIMCTDEALEILEIQPAGKKIMPANQYLNGQRLLQVGDKLL